MPKDENDYDPLRDETRQFTMREWGEQAKKAIDDYVESLDQKNPITRGTQTWRQWMNAFIGYMSW